MSTTTSATQGDQDSNAVVRPRVQIDGNAIHHTNAKESDTQSEGQLGNPKCSGCGYVKTMSDFLPEERKKPEGEAKCIACVSPGWEMPNTEGTGNILQLSEIDNGRPFGEAFRPQMTSSKEPLDTMLVDSQEDEDDENDDKDDHRTDYDSDDSEPPY